MLMCTRTVGCTMLDGHGGACGVWNPAWQRYDPIAAPVAPGHKPTTEQMRDLWMKRMPYTNFPERHESELGFEEWLADVRGGRA